MQEELPGLLQNWEGQFNRGKNLSVDIGKGVDLINIMCSRSVVGAAGCHCV